MASTATAAMSNTGNNNDVVVGGVGEDDDQDEGKMSGVEGEEEHDGLTDTNKTKEEQEQEQERKRKRRSSSSPRPNDDDENNDAIILLSSATNPLQETIEKFRIQIQRMEQLETALKQRIVQSRRRAMLLQSSSHTIRNSHLRLFITHSYKPELTAAGAMAALMQQPASTGMGYGGTSNIIKPSPPIWTLHIEGKRLIDHLDHLSAKQYDTKIGYAKSDGGTRLDSTEEERPAPDMEHPIKLTHLFDKVVVNFQTVFVPKQSSNKPAAAMASPPSSNKKKSSSRNKSPAAAPNKKQQQHQEEPVVDDRILSEKQQVIWKLEDSIDSDIWSFQYTEPKNHPGGSTTSSSANKKSSSSNYKVQSVIADLELYRRHEYVTSILSSADHSSSDHQQPVQVFPHKYRILSNLLQQKLFPHYGPETTDILTGKKRKWKKGTSIQYKNTMIVEAGSSSSTTATTAGGGGGTATGDTNNVDNNAEPIPSHNEVHVPSSMTMSEIANAFYVYIHDRKLMGDYDDQSVINADQLLQDLLNVEQFSFSELQQLLITRRLIEQINDDLDDPVRVTYILEQETASNLGEEPSDPDSAGILQLDMDIRIPNFYNYRVRDLLRRMKRRERVYTSSRTKAQQQYLHVHSVALHHAQAASAAATNASTRRAAAQQLAAAKEEEDEIVRHAIEQAVAGGGGGSDVHTNAESIPVHLALAKAAPPGSEVRNNAHCDARILYLLSHLPQRIDKAKEAWNRVQACQELLQMTDHHQQHPAQAPT